MKYEAPDQQGTRHCLSDWLTLHEFDPRTCRQVLDAFPDPSAESFVRETLEAEWPPLDLEVAWQTTCKALCAFLPRHQGIIEDTFQRTAKIIVDRTDGSRKAITLDNGPEEYPTIVYSYRGDPADCLVLAHEFAHAVQIRASRGKFVSPILRETCAFLGEGALLSHATRGGSQQIAGLVAAWQSANTRYLGAQKARLRAALMRPHTPYKYSWNYPIARHLAILMSERCSAEVIWCLFEGQLTVSEILQTLAVEG